MVAKEKIYVFEKCFDNLCNESRSVFLCGLHGHQLHKVLKPAHVIQECPAKKKTKLVRKFEEISTVTFLFVLKDWRKILATRWRQKSLLILAIPIRVFRLSRMRLCLIHDKLWRVIRVKIKYTNTFQF